MHRQKISYILKKHKRNINSSLSTEARQDHFPGILVKITAYHQAKKMLLHVKETNFCAFLLFQHLIFLGSMISPSQYTRVEQNTTSCRLTDCKLQLRRIAGCEKHKNVHLLARNSSYNQVQISEIRVGRRRDSLYFIQQISIIDCFLSLCLSDQTPQPVVCGAHEAAPPKKHTHTPIAFALSELNLHDHLITRSTAVCTTCRRR
jgi:hypothetical protein